ncbi:MAG: PTS transporter subunit EIIC [Selenomonadales bacterium]|nr:PTS transporter subunit EIIC [Selenomonadales bacterium]MEE1362816.1 PTS transporter subunit EIIC [Selenomonadaceae bacterium]
MNNELMDKFINAMGRFAELKEVVAVKDGFIITTPFTLVGSLFLLIACLPIPGWTEFMAGIFGPNWQAPIWAVCGGTFNVLALIVVAAITYKYVDNEGLDGITASGLATAAFIIILPPEVATESGEVVGNVIPKNWAGSNGIITAIIVSFITSYIYCYCIKHHIGVKMPDTVPGGVVRAFEALTPAFFVFLLAAGVWSACHFMGDTTAPELIFQIIQIPLQGLTDSLGGAIVITGLQPLLFWTGIHGPNVVMGVVSPLLFANCMDNQALLDAGQTLVGNPAAKLVTGQVDFFVRAGGCGATFGLIIAAWICAKSEQMRSLMKLSTVPGLFNINEPIIFGLPIVFNGFMLFPFVMVPVISVIITYFTLYIGFLPPMGAIQIPWTTPPILAGLLMDGWQGAVVQAICLAVSVAIYFPFVKILDKKMQEEEAAAAAEIE